MKVKHLFLEQNIVQAFLITFAGGGKGKSIEVSKKFLTKLVNTRQLFNSLKLKDVKVVSQDTTGVLL